MELIWIIIGVIGLILAVKIAVFIVKGMLKLAVVTGIIALAFYLVTNLNILSLLH
ncbi:hypothetical protein ACFLZ7_04355 [Nanoarchaeota archaeon]